MDANNHEHRPEERYEHADVNIWAIGRFGIALAILCVLSLGLLFGLFRYFTAREGGPLPPGPIDARRKPPAPTLQETPVIDLREMRAAEDQILNSYGWIDQPHGVVRVPIARAIDMLAQRGLPSRQQAPPPLNVSVPTESGLGPKMLPPGGPLSQGSGISGGNGQGN
jgi:hypothetical protein